MRRTSFLAVLVALVALIAASCGGGDDALTVYSGRSESLVGPLLDQFTEDTGIEVDVRYGDSGDLALLIAEEGGASPADVFYSQAPGAVAFLAADNLLAVLDAEILGIVDERFASPAGLWVGASGRQRVLVYNSDLVDPDELPDSVFDLTARRFRGQVGLAPQNGSFQDFVTAMRQIDGEERAQRWLSDMAANDARSYAKNSAIVEAVGRGEIPLGLVNHYYGFQALQEDPDLPIANHIFEAGDTGALVIASTASVLASSDKKPEGERLVEYLLGESAQRYFAEETFEYPLRPGVAPPIDVPALEALDPPAYDPSQNADLDDTARAIRDSGLE